MDNKLRRKSGVRFLPKVANAVFRVDDTIAFVAKSNTDASVNITMEKNEVKGGQDNALLGAIFSDTAVEVSFTSVEWKPEFLAANIGSPIKVGSFDFMAEDLKLKAVDNSGKIEITLPAVPTDKRIFIENNGGYMEVSAATTIIDVTAYGYQEGDCLNIIAMFPRKGKRIAIGTEQTPLVGELILTSPIFEGTKGKVGKSQYKFDAFQFNGNFTQNFSNDASFEMTGNAIASPSDSCDEGDLYGSYQEYLDDETEITNYSTILAVPSLIEITGTGDQVISVYGIKNALYDRALIEPGADLVFSIPSKDNGVATVAQTGTVTGVASGSTTVTVTYKERLIATVDVVVS
ncbi:Ig-like domain-containing protein [Anaerocolumna aminovalerica]|uniref:Ig-like domain-containing protein n=1 Tax=Anaerocolumna aminovalerica TaxID=1527 RepID=UPI001C0E9BA6|nr:Ig-like domain-containing protein [Anaerocolumna aminovalerica]MBU5332104.1 Ig-like domain-containing protein [Anaerocolumna aminovalerica]